MKTIGILGGMGPAATVDLHAKIIAATAAARDQDHLRVLIDSNPALPDRHAAIEGRGPSPGPILGHMAAALERAGADLVVMACNTAHAFQRDIEATLTVPFLSMIDATVDAALLAVPGLKRVAVLAADGCLRARLYESAFAARDVEEVTLDAGGQAEFMALVYRIKGGETGEAVRAAMRALAGQFDTEALVAGCTEVSLVLSSRDWSRGPVIDSAAALAARAVALARA